jgi:hypothetical protein
MTRRDSLVSKVAAAPGVPPTQSLQRILLANPGNFRAKRASIGDTTVCRLKSARAPTSHHQSVGAFVSGASSIRYADCATPKRPMPAKEVSSSEAIRDRMQLRRWLRCWRHTRGIHELTG